MPIDIRITVFKAGTHPQILDALERVGKTGQSGRDYLLERAGPITGEHLKEMAEETKRRVLEQYESKFRSPGTRRAVRFLGGYGRSVLVRYRAQTAQVWPWAYVGLYPQPGADSLQARNPQIYIPSIEKGAPPRGYKTPKGYRRRRKGEARPVTSSGMYERVSYWAQEKMGFAQGTREHHDFVWLTMRKLLRFGTRSRRLFEATEYEPGFLSWLWEAQDNLVDDVVSALAEE